MAAIIPIPSGRTGYDVEPVMDFEVSTCYILISRTEYVCPVFLVSNNVSEKFHKNLIRFKISFPMVQTFFD